VRVTIGGSPALPPGRIDATACPSASKTEMLGIFMAGGVGGSVVSQTSTSSSETATLPKSAVFTNATRTPDESSLDPDQLTEDDRGLRPHRGDVMSRTAT
jgi:hypothetical protein